MRSRLQNFDKENSSPLDALCIAFLLALSTSLCLLTYYAVPGTFPPARRCRRPPPLLALCLKGPRSGTQMTLAA